MIDYSKIELEIEDAFQEILKLDLLNPNVYESILEIIDKGIKLRPSPKNIIPAGTMFYRSRCHENEDKFDNISEISYINNVDKIIKYERANKPHQSIFYCGDQWSTAVFEAGRISRIKNNVFPDNEIHTVTKRWHHAY